MMDSGHKAPTALFTLLALLLLLSPLAGAGFDDFKGQQGKTFSDRLTGDWMGLATIAVAICIFFNLLVYMAGFALHSEHLKRYAKSEFLQVSASSLMIFFSIALLYQISSSGIDFMGDVLGAGASSVSCAAMPTGKFELWQDSKFGSGPMGAFKCKVQEKITALDKAYDNVFNSNMAQERLESLCISLFGAPVYCWSWNLELHQKVEEAHLVATKIVSLLVPLHAQYSLAEYLQRNMLAIFLPAGLVLRVFPLTRGVGGLFIAIAIGFFFVFPTFIVLTDPTFVKVDEVQKDQQAGKCFTGFTGSAVLLASIDTGSMQQSAIATASGAELVYQLTVGALFYPFVSLVLTLMFIRAATPLLGGDTGEIMRMVSRLG